MSLFSKIDKFHQTRRGKLTFAVVELVVSYLVISRAIDTGSLWQYLIFILLVIGAIVNLIRAVFGGNTNSNAKSRSKK